MRPTSRLGGVLPPSARRLMKGALRAVGHRLGTPISDEVHPERLAVLARVADGADVIEVGCGHRKTSASYVGVDLTPGGARGRVGNVEGEVSQADVAASGIELPFRSEAFDALVARHNLEHYIDVVAVLREWRRVVRPSGSLVLVVPDEERYAGNTLALDPTHYHAFSERALDSLLPLVGWTPQEIGPCIEGWSLVCVATRA